jgi:hypothetical protein
MQRLWSLARKPVQCPWLVGDIAVAERPAGHFDG